RLVPFARVRTRQDRAGGRATVTMALRGNEESWPRSRASGDAPRKRCVQGDAGEVGPQRRPQHRAIDAAWLVPAGTLQVDERSGDPRHADGAQADQDPDSGRGEKLAGDIAWLRVEGRQDDE